MENKSAYSSHQTLQLPNAIYLHLEERLSSAYGDVHSFNSTDCPHSPDCCTICWSFRGRGGSTRNKSLVLSVEHGVIWPLDSLAMSMKAGVNSVDACHANRL